MQSVFEHLTENTLILTANKRLARHLQHEYADFQLKQNKKAWKSLDILPLHAWLIRCWETMENQGESLPLLLNSHQTWKLWHSIITQNSDSLLQIQSVIPLATETWELLKNWNLNLEDLIFFAPEDAKTFIRFAEQFDSLCKKNSWVDSASIFPRIEKSFIEKKLPAPEKIILAGFIEIHPAIQHLLDSVCKQQINLQRPPLEPQPKINIIECQDTRTEIETMVYWSYDILNKNMHAKIGCVVPQLTQTRQMIDRMYRHTEKNLKLKNSHNISIGGSLLQEPLIAVFFELLQFLSRPVSFQDFSFLLLTPYLKGFDVERDLRAKFETDLRKKNQTLLNKNDLQNLSLEIPELFLNIIQKSNLPLKQTPFHWIKTFRQIIKHLCFYNKKEQQALEKLDQLFDEFATLEIIETEMSFDSAFYALKQIVSRTIFQSDSNLDAPIQILGTLEAIDIPFTHLWIMGMDDQTWPSSPKPNPFIPIQLQQQLQMQHCSAKHELDFALKISDRLMNQAKTIMVSYPQFTETRKNRLSPIFKGTTKPISLEMSMNPLLPLEYSPNFDYVVDRIAPAILENKSIHGGTDILKKQSECPFQAFAKYRLHAEKLETPEEGIDAKTKGILLHHALEKIWTKIKTHEKLCSLANSELNEIISSSFPVQEEIFFQIEKERLIKIIFDWMYLEKTRAPFKVISTEKKLSAKIGKLDLTLRIDRIDKTMSEENIIIDYKTSKTHVTDWFQDRMNEPQLPLYASLYPLVSSIAFAQLRSDELAFKGVSRNKNMLPGDKTIEEVKAEQSANNWNNQLKHWKKQCEMLANEFADGIADVSPKHKERCKYCGLQSLCRIYE